MNHSLSNTKPTLLSPADLTKILPQKIDLGTYWQAGDHNPIHYQGERRILPGAYIAQQLHEHYEQPLVVHFKRPLIVNAQGQLLHSTEDAQVTGDNTTSLEIILLENDTGMQTAAETYGVLGRFWNRKHVEFEVRETTPILVAFGIGTDDLTPDLSKKQISKIRTGVYHHNTSRDNMHAYVFTTFPQENIQHLMRLYLNPTDSKNRTGEQ